MDKRTEAKKFLKSLDQNAVYTMKKIAAKEGSNQMLTFTHRGQFRVFDMWDLETNDFRASLWDAASGERIITSPVIDAGRTPDGIILIETLNSVYRLELA